MRNSWIMLLTFVFISSVGITQPEISKIVQTTEKYWSVDENPEPSETQVTFFDTLGNVTRLEEYILDSLVGINLATYDSQNREKTYTRLDADSNLISRVTFFYKAKGKSKTRIVIKDENNEIFSKELEKRNDFNKVVMHKINYVEGKMKSKVYYQYDEKGREIGYKSYDGKRLDFFILREYNDKNFVILERMGVEPNGEDNLVYEMEYPKVDLNDNWTEQHQFVEGKLYEKITRTITYH